MLPTQVSGLSFVTTVAHAYYKQNTILFIASLWIYTTTLIYHFTKTYLARPERTRRLIYYIDVTSCIIFYFACIYDHVTLHSLGPMHSIVIYGMHAGLPVFYMIAGHKKALMWSSDHDESERWHAIFHLGIQLETHLYLSWSK